MPLSYYVPPNYFQNIPANMRVDAVQRAPGPRVVVECGNRMVSANMLDDYTFQTEKLISTYGLNVYDATLWTIAVAKLGGSDAVLKYFNSIVLPHKTCQFQSTVGDRPCKGIVVTGGCNGDCGLCYGDGQVKTLTGLNAWFFRTISPLYSMPEMNSMCPTFGVAWLWNDWMPVLGENAWARLIGPLQMGYIIYGGVAGIPTSIVDFSVQFLVSLEKMLIPEIGAFYYAPHNTYGTDDKQGSQISTENQISTLAGLAILKTVLQAQNVHMDKIATIDTYIGHIKRYLSSSFNTGTFYFRNGGGWNLQTKQFTWYPEFAVDCQTWGMSVIGLQQMAAWFGSGTAKGVWDTTMKLGGYGYNGTFVKGLGYSFNQEDQVLSGEWTLGAINMLKIWANQSDAATAASYRAEAAALRQVIESSLTNLVNFNGQEVPSVLYSNKRYWVPFGWWANPLPSIASTAWAAMVDTDFNPFYLGGDYSHYNF